MNENSNCKINFSVLSNEMEDVKSKIVSLLAKDSLLMANITSLTAQNSALETKLSELEAQLKAKVKFNLDWRNRF